MVSERKTADHYHDRQTSGREATRDATLNYETGQIHWTEDEQYNSETFLAFLQQILSAYPSGKITMVLDNARIHHARLLQPFLEENRDRLVLVFLPAYSPQFNLVEALWKWLKADVINNVFYSTVAEICLRLEDGCLSGIL